jgi:hypothetical protein
MKRTQQLLPIALFLGFLGTSLSLAAQRSANQYFNNIRDNEAALTAFMAHMPKGGDLHNHYSGALYAEGYLQRLIDSGFCINTTSLSIESPVKGSCKAGMVPFASLAGGTRDSVRSALLRLWSCKDYDQVHTDTRADHFFATFGKFGIVSWMDYPAGLLELKHRAKVENVSYIETMFTRVPLLPAAKAADLLSNKDTIAYYNKLLLQLELDKDEARLKSVLANLYQKVMQSIPIEQSAVAYNKMIDSLHQILSIDDAQFTMRYQTFIARIDAPLITFINLVASFHSVDRSKTGYLVGLNIVAPEDNVTSMRDYWLHMHYFAFCNAQYKGRVPYAMHAGELTEGFVQPEQLSYHINDAIYVAGAQRIGHGVDIAYEKNCYELLDYMSKDWHNIPVEINLSSNEFILGVKDDRHPILLYQSFNVPLVISTDDAGVSRSSLTEQYVLLAKRYPSLSYTDIKHYVYNSIQYSFMSAADKRSLIKDLDDRFAYFEQYYSNRTR